MPDDGQTTETLDQPQLPPSNALQQQYEVMDLLGKGGMGYVFLAKHRTLPKHAAIKVLNEKLQPDSRSRLRFEQEARAASSLSHPNIVDVYDYGIADDGSPYLVMDYVRGHGLSDVISNEGALDIDRCLAIATQVASALQHAHSSGVVHRDIKPANIMLVDVEQGDEFAKLVDFGAAILTKESAAGSPQELTQKGKFIGSPLYMSPEQIRGERGDERSDIYALGCTIYEALSGRPPFKGETALSTMMAHLEDTPPSFVDVDSEREIPAKLEAIVQKCLAKQPDLRFQSAAELRRELLNSGKSSPDHRLEDEAERGSEVRVPSQSIFASGIIRAATIVSLIVTSSLIGALVCLSPPAFLKDSAERLFHGPKNNVRLLNSVRQKLQARQFALEAELQKARWPMPADEIAVRRDLSATIDNAILAVQMKLDEPESSKQVDKDLALGLMTFGDQFRNLRDPESAQVLYLCAAEVLTFLGLEQSELSADIGLRRGIVAHASHDNTLALKFYDQALEMNEALRGPQHELVAEVLGWRAVAHFQVCQPERAEKDWIRATDIIKKVGSQESRLKLMGIFAAQTKLYASVHNKGKAEKAYENFISLFEQLKTSHPEWVDYRDAEIIKKQIEALN